MMKYIVMMSIFLVVFAYFVYKPFPKGAAEPWKQSMVATGYEIVELLGFVSETLGLTSHINVTRWITTMSGLVFTARNTVLVSEELIDGVKVRISRPKNVHHTLPGLMYFHGGGFVICDPGCMASVTDLLSEELKAVVISVDYRLAPEHPYPAAFDDCLAATRHVIQHADRLGIDKYRIGLAGDSAGGGLTLSVALKLSSNLDPQLAPIKVIGPIYPGLQAFDFRLPSYIQFKDGPSLLSLRRMAMFYLNYMKANTTYLTAFLSNTHVSKSLRQSVYASRVSPKLLPPRLQTYSEAPEQQDGDEDVSNEIQSILLDPFFAPLMSDDATLKMLPPTCVLIAELDILRDDGFLLAERLKGLGVQVQLLYYEGYEHAFLSFVDIYSGAANAVHDLAKCLSQYL
ncbi:hypothetical protein ACJMK2_018267 [Sinanodonta woodiana]|uniref:Alpha/beta hydrolase fold-3 domain-containing protein n=1 Tax=Sinanodonta woodiana TaxID=1069815 RepID=A0ABD3UCY8_SINWO